MKQIKIYSAKLNFFLHTVRILCNLFIPFAIFLYVSRVLGPAGLGKVEYAHSIVSYFVLFTSLGIPTYGSREIARSRNNEMERSRVVCELTLIHITITGIGYIAYFIIIRFIPSLYSNWILFCVIAPTILLSTFNYEWFFVGIEDQLYISIRFFAVKILQLMLIFLCVKSSKDLIIYAGIIIGMNNVSTLFNIIRVKQYVYIVPISQLNIKRHLKPALLIFFSGAAASIYMNLDITMVGIMVGDEAVGLYTAANKLIRLTCAFIFAMPSVMLPRINNALENGNRTEYKNSLNKSFRFILFFCIPCTVGIVFLSPEIIEIFVGETYRKSILSIRLLSPIILITGLTQIVGFQILLPNKKEEYFTMAVIIAAITNGIFNFFMIPLFKQNGAIFGTVLAELLVLLIQSVFAGKLLKDIELFSVNTIKYFIAAIVMCFVILFIKSKMTNNVLILIVCICTGALVYVGILVLLREEMILTMNTRNY
jgi:O-antigen/teichoic acid export membrane protein